MRPLGGPDGFPECLDGLAGLGGLQQGDGAVVQFGCRPAVVGVRLVGRIGGKVEAGAGGAVGMAAAQGEAGVIEEQRRRRRRRRALSRGCPGRRWGYGPGNSHGGQVDGGRQCQAFPARVSFWACRCR